MIEPQKIKLKFSDLENLSQEELLNFVNQTNKLKAAHQFKKDEAYLKSSHPGQIKFHKDTHRIQYILSGNRRGKTTSGFVELKWRNLGTHPFKKVKVPIKSAIVVQDFENHAKNVLEPKLKEWCASNDVKKIERHQGGAIKRIIWSSGSVSDVFSHDQDLKVFEGSDYDVVWFDEPPPRQIWVAMWRGCTDRGGSMYLTATPLTSPWIYEEWQKTKGEPTDLSIFIEYKGDDNLVNLGEGSIELGKKRIEDLASLYTSEEKEARLNGGFIQLQGLIFKTWSRPIHLIPKFDWPNTWNIIESIDPHPQKAWAVTWLGIAKNGAKILLKSAYIQGVIDEIANTIILNRKDLGIKDGLNPRIVRTLIDNSSSVPLWQKSSFEPTARRVSVREELNNLIGPQGAGGPTIETCPKNVSQKIDIMKRWLHVKQRGNKERPDFFVFDTSDNEGFIKEMENYVWDRYRNRARDNELKPHPVKKNDDLLDSVMQCCIVLGDDDILVEAQSFSMVGNSDQYID
jgi:phage terminase large subunit-like protein